MSKRVLEVVLNSPVRVSADLYYQEDLTFIHFKDLIQAAGAALVFSYSGFDETAADVVHVVPL